MAETMRVVECAGPGGTDVLRLAQRPVPVPAAGEVLIRVAAVGMNQADLWQRRGLYPPPDGASDLMGLEVSGTIAAIGAGAAGWHEGQEVSALLASGGYAEYCVVPVGQLLPIPSGIMLATAAALPEACATVWHNVYERAHLQPGESLLVHGGTSGIGTFAIQIARARGSAVYATAGSDEKCATAVRLGATRAINYRETDFVTAILAATSDRGVDVILDLVGGDYLSRNLSCLATEGRLTIISTQRGAHADLDLRLLMRRRLTIVGSTLRAQSSAAKARILAAVRAEIWPLLESGTVAPVIDRTFPLTEAAAAHAYLESGRHMGKIVLVV